MTIEQLMRKYKTRSELHELTTEERELYEAFVGLGETEVDRRILSLAWLKHHAVSTR